MSDSIKTYDCGYRGDDDPDVTYHAMDVTLNFSSGIVTAGTDFVLDPETCVVSYKKKSLPGVQMKRGGDGDSSLTFAFNTEIKATDDLAKWFEGEIARYQPTHRTVTNCDYNLRKPNKQPDQLAFTFGGKLRNMGADNRTIRLFLGCDHNNYGHNPWYVSSPDMTCTCAHETESNVFTCQIIPLSPSSEPFLAPHADVPQPQPPPPPPPVPVWKKITKVLLIGALIFLGIMLVLKLVGKK